MHQSFGGQTGQSHLSGACGFGPREVHQFGLGLGHARRFLGPTTGHKLAFRPKGLVLPHDLVHVFLPSVQGFVELVDGISQLDIGRQEALSHIQRLQDVRRFAIGLGSLGLPALYVVL